MERRREVEERYADAQEGPGAVAVGGGDWKEANGTSAMENSLKRARSPDDDRDERMVRLLFCIQGRSVILVHSGNGQGWMMILRQRECNAYIDHISQVWIVSRSINVQPAL
jgi:hypothetical protein